MQIAHSKLSRAAIAVAMTLLSTGASAQTLDDMPPLEGPVILTVSGMIAESNMDDGSFAFDLEMLRHIGGDEIETDTIWTPDTVTYTGVRLDRLLNLLGAEGENLDATAINDYSVEIPTSDAVEGGPIIAYEADGKVMSRRDKGPLWVIYPYASTPDYRTEVIYSRSIWQLDRITVKE
ncbi:molybdopterin-dependent oxidoreductase [Sagittula sp. SSi028]|uniref:molybdopterin-dependent oxidoreductase n=1 Tax=Sagittula sp. SSi028 TaxID=3400636 RepID=UPI003AF92F89